MGAEKGNSLLRMVEDVHLHGWVSDLDTTEKAVTGSWRQVLLRP